MTLKKQYVSAAEHKMILYPKEPGSSMSFSILTPDYFCAMIPYFAQSIPFLRNRKKATIARKYEWWRGSVILVEIGEVQQD